MVLSGSLRLHVDGEVHDLMAGDSVSFSADKPHSYENAGLVRGPVPQRDPLRALTTRRQRAGLLVTACLV